MTTSLSEPTQLLRADRLSRLACGDDRRVVGVDTCAAASLASQSLARYRSRDGASLAPSRPGLSLPYCGAATEASTADSRPGLPSCQGGGLRRRLLVASLSRAWNQPQGQLRLLGAEARTERRAGSADRRSAGRCSMAERACLGRRGPDSGRKSRGAHRYEAPQTVSGLARLPAYGVEPSCKTTETAQVALRTTPHFCPIFCPISVSLGGSQWVWMRENR